MAALLVILSVGSILAVRGQENASLVADPTNSTKDMYVIHATVYQVGIITNKSDEEIANMTGNQEALTFYHSNGSTVDLSAIPAPLVTNVTAQSVVGLAPAPAAAAAGDQPWAAFDGMTAAAAPAVPSANSFRTPDEDNLGHRKRADFLPYLTVFKRSLQSNESNAGPAIKVVKETAVIPPAAGLQAIGLPLLVGLNTSLASLPVPVPNTSIIRYAKLNTLVQAP